MERGECPCIFHERRSNASRRLGGCGISRRGRSEVDVRVVGLTKDQSVMSDTERSEAHCERLCEM